MAAVGSAQSAPSLSLQTHTISEPSLFLASEFSQIFERASSCRVDANLTLVFLGAKPQLCSYVESQKDVDGIIDLVPSLTHLFNDIILLSQRTVKTITLSPEARFTLINEITGSFSIVSPTPIVIETAAMQVMKTTLSSLYERLHKGPKTLILARHQYIQALGLDSEQFKGSKEMDRVSRLRVFYNAMIDHCSPPGTKVEFNAGNLKIWRLEPSGSTPQTLLWDSVDGIKISVRKVITSTEISSDIITRAARFVNLFDGCEEIVIKPNCSLTIFDVNPELCNEVLSCRPELLPNAITAILDDLLVVKQMRVVKFDTTGCLNRFRDGEILSVGSPSLDCIVDRDKGSFTFKSKKTINIKVERLQNVRTTLSSLLKKMQLDESLYSFSLKPYERLILLDEGFKKIGLKASIYDEISAQKLLDLLIPYIPPGFKIAIKSTDYILEPACSNSGRTVGIQLYASSGFRIALQKVGNPAAGGPKQEGKEAEKPASI